MICIKTDIKHMPEYCDDCQWFETRPHPMKGWSDGCGLMMQCMDDDQPEEWIYDGNGRPKACPLIEVEDGPQTFDKPPKCLGCLYSDLDKAFHPCASCVDFGKYVGEVSGKDEPQPEREGE